MKSFSEFQAECELDEGIVDDVKQKWADRKVKSNERAGAKTEILGHYKNWRKSYLHMKKMEKNYARKKGGWEYSSDNSMERRRVIAAAKKVRDHKKNFHDSLRKHAPKFSKLVDKHRVPSSGSGFGIMDAILLSSGVRAGARTFGGVGGAIAGAALIGGAMAGHAAYDHARHGWKRSEDHIDWLKAEKRDKDRRARKAEKSSQ
jgi:hypothetical protein